MSANHQACVTEVTWLDCRSAEEFAQGHCAAAAHFDWPQLQQRLNELPAAPTTLGLIAPADEREAIQAFLRDKGYKVEPCLTEAEFNNLVHTGYFTSHPESPGLVIGSTSARLWSPNPLLQHLIENNQLTLLASAQKNALDLGCGGGRDAVFLAEQGWRVTAIDQEQRVLERAQRLADNSQQHVDWRCCNLRQADCLPHTEFDLILMMRFLNRDLYPFMLQHTRPGGYVLIQTFVEGVEGVEAFASPKNPQFILQKGELAKVFAEYEVIIDNIEPLADGRPVQSFLARRIS